MPLRDSPTVVMGHGGGGAMSAELVDHVFLPSFGDDLLDAARRLRRARPGRRTGRLLDRLVCGAAAVLPGGSIGDLAVNGTVNDLAMSGATPLSCRSLHPGGGHRHHRVGAVAERLGPAAQRAGVRVVTGDTKVVESGHGDGIYVNTAGIGVVPDGVDVRPDRAQVGDLVIVSGDIGVHGVAVMSVREGLQFGTEILSDCAPLNGLVDAMLSVTRDLHVLRDPTRGGVATSLNEIAKAAEVGIALDERSLPIPEVVANACSFLGLDPLQVANEGKLLAFVAPEDADAVLAAMREHPFGRTPTVIGECVEEHPGMVSARTGFGASRVVDLPIGEQLPRIC